MVSPRRSYVEQLTCRRRPARWLCRERPGVQLMPGPASGRPGRRTRPDEPAGGPRCGSAPDRVAPPRSPPLRAGATARIACRTAPELGSHPLGPVARRSSGPCDSGTGVADVPVEGGLGRSLAVLLPCALVDRRLARHAREMRRRRRVHATTGDFSVASCLEAGGPGFPPDFPHQLSREARFPVVSPTPGDNAWVRLNTSKEAG